MNNIPSREWTTKEMLDICIAHNYNIVDFVSDKAIIEISAPWMYYKLKDLLGQELTRLVSTYVYYTEKYMYGDWVNENAPYLVEKVNECKQWLKEHGEEG